MNPLVPFLVLTAGFAAITLPAHAASRPATPPNIVVVLTDDQGWGDLSLTGNQNFRTPNIDSIGRDGAIFDRFFVCAVCAPTRAEFFTGRYHPRGGVRGVTTGLERLNVDEKTIGDAFKAAGYATGAFGKWHNGSQWPYHPNARGFDEFYGFTSGHWAEYFDALVEHNGKPLRGRGYITDDLTDQALAFIEKNRSRPFFCYVPYPTPHSPWCVPDEYWDRYKDRPIPQRGREADNENLAVTRCALAMVENIDWNVGRILRKLDELRLRENTIVIYFSDNGPNSPRWNGEMKGTKGSTDEGGVRSPFLIRWPNRIQSGTTIREIAGAIDLLPTLTRLAGIPRVGTKPLDGRDISPLLLGTARDWPDRRIFSHQNGNVSVRTQRYRLDARGELFDLVADPGQRTDISAQQPKITAELRQAVADWRREVLGTAAAATPPPAQKTKDGKSSRPAVPDDRPFPVGYTEFPMTPLPARDGVPQGEVRRSAVSPNSTYFTNWKSTADTMTWDIEVNQAGEYDVAVLYSCPPADVGSIVELTFRNATLTAKIAQAWDAPFLDQKDRITRSQSQMKDFRPLPLGTIRLEKGRGPLILRAREIAGQQVMEVRMITLTLRTG
jgi:arylsulfatase A-like enzyme